MGVISLGSSSERTKPLTLQLFHLMRLEIPGCPVQSWYICNQMLNVTKHISWQHHNTKIANSTTLAATS